MRKVQFQTGEYYHIYNRGVDKREVFIDEKDYVRFLIGMKEFNNKSTDSERDYYKRKMIKTKQEAQEEAQEETQLSLGYPRLSCVSSCVSSISFPNMPKLVEIICYCLNPNHYHFMLKQLVENGISIFMQKLGLGYTNYFNKKYSRSGSLFQGTFKSVHIEENGYLLWLTGYINGNSEIHKIDKAENWIYSSYQDYLGKRNGKLCNKNIIMEDFENIQEYKELVETIIKESAEIKEGKKEWVLE